MIVSISKSVTFYQFVVWKVVSNCNFQGKYFLQQCTNILTSAYIGFHNLSYNKKSDLGKIDLAQW